jgi:hypothetical protein
MHWPPSRAVAVTSTWLPHRAHSMRIMRPSERSEAGRSAITVDTMSASAAQGMRKPAPAWPPWHPSACAGKAYEAELMSPIGCPRGPLR